VDKDIGTATGERGPVERKLDEYGVIMGLCFGAWGEGSKDVHELVDVIAKSRLKHQVDPGNKQIAKKRQ